MTDRLGSHLADIGGSGYAAMPYSIEFLEDRDVPIQGGGIGWQIELLQYTHKRAVVPARLGGWGI